MKHISRRAPTRNRTGVDLEEIRPHHFIVREPKVRPLLKGEGVLNGQIFELTSWRRDGLMGRMRDNGFVVRTLADQIERLSRPPHAMPIGQPMLRPLVSDVERFSYFDPLPLGWVPIEPQVEGELRSVALRAGWVVRRRRGRGSSTFHQVFAERGGTVGLRPFDEDRALLTGFGQIVTPRELIARRAGKDYLLPEIELPRAYRETLGRFAKQGPQGWQVMERGWPLAQDLYAKLGLLLRTMERE